MLKNWLFFFGCAVAVHAQTVPLGVVVAVPDPSADLGISIPIPTSFTLLITSGLPGPTQVSAVAKTSAEGLTLLDGPINPPTFFVDRRCSESPLPPCAGDLRQGAPVFYPLTGGVGGVPSLPAETVVAVTIAPPGQEPFPLATGSFLRGVEQSADLMTLTITGSFNPAAATSLYFGLWPLAIHPQAALILPDRITISLIQDHTAFARISGWYPITVLQNNVCDTVMLHFQSPFVPRGPTSSGLLY
jgi:hypothetical protein